MSDEEPIHLASIAWERGKWADFPGKYAREHLWYFTGSAKLKASESPYLTPEGYRVPFIRATAASFFGHASVPRSIRIAATQSPEPSQ
jgi:hypothetical protein